MIPSPQRLQSLGSTFRSHADVRKYCIMGSARFRVARLEGSRVTCKAVWPWRDAMRTPNDSNRISQHDFGSRGETSLHANAPWIMEVAVSWRMP